MKTNRWIWILVATFLLCAGLGFCMMLPRDGAASAKIISDGKLLYTLDLRVDQTLTVVSENGENTVTVRDGKIAVTKADCPDHYCIDRGFCSGGVQIVCLPNRLVIQFVGQQKLDDVSG